MTDEQMKAFLDSIAAATLANKAIFTLYMAGLPITPENAALAYGRWIDPAFPQYEQFVGMINAQVCEMMDTAVEISPPTKGNA